MNKKIQMIVACHKPYWRSQEPMYRYIEVGTALRQRPDTGLLAGLWEYPHVPGRLTEEQAARQLRQWGLTPRAWLRQLDARHIFTHIRWEMTGYLVQVEGLGPADWLWADGARRQRLAIPSAFDQFTRALPAEGD